MRGWSEIRELLNRWNLLYRVDRRECYDYVEVMRKKGFDDLDQIVNMNNEDLKALTVEVGMEKEQASKFINNVRQRYGLMQERCALCCSAARLSCLCDHSAFLVYFSIVCDLFSLQVDGLPRNASWQIDAAFPSVNASAYKMRMRNG